MTDDLEMIAVALFTKPAPPGRFTAKIPYEDELRFGREWLRRLAGQGWSTPTWPGRFGGCEASPAQARRIQATLERFGPPDLHAFRIGMGVVGPTILTHGTPEQCAKWLPPISCGDEIFCQLFSEPGAGSDLANVSMRARRTPQGWRLDGQKVWTSRAPYSDWGLCLARTDADVPKHHGLTMFVVDMTDSSVDVRPLRQMNGSSRFNEVFITGALISDTWRLGEVGSGWTVAMTALANERTGMAAHSPALRDGLRRLPDWLRELASRAVFEDPVLRDRAMRVYILEQVAALTGHWARAGGPAASGGKLRQSRTFKARAGLVKDAAGATGLLAGTAGDEDFFTAPSMSLMGGTDEVQLNVLGERVLGLPKEPRVDHDVPWTVSRRGGL